MVGVLQVFSKHDITGIQHGGESGDRKISYAPRILILVGDTDIQDEAPEGVSGLVDSAQGLDEERQGAVVGHHFDDALPDPGGELGTEGDFSSFVALPTSMVGSTRGAERESGLGHDKEALSDMGYNRVERTEAAVPFWGSVVNRHDVAFRGLFEANEIREEARWKGVAPAA